MMINESDVSGGMRIGRRNQSTKIEIVQIPIDTPQILHDVM
jgi:hypothetical protein